MREGCRPVAGGLVFHGHGTTEMVRSAALSQLRPTAVNTWLHWQALRRAQERGSSVFDFGRPTIGSSVYTFKERFGARPQPSNWQHYIRGASPGVFRRAGGKIRRLDCLVAPAAVISHALGWTAIAKGIP